MCVCMCALLSSGMYIIMFLKNGMFDAHYNYTTFQESGPYVCTVAWEHSGEGTVRHCILISFKYA